MDNKKIRTSSYIPFAFVAFVSPLINLLQANEKNLLEEEREPELYHFSSATSSDRSNEQPDTNICDLLSCIAKNYSSSLDEIIPLLKPVLTPSMDVSSISSLLEFSVKVPTNELPLILSLTKNICLVGEELDYSDYFENMGEIILEIASEQREVTVANAQHLFTPDMDNYYRATILEAVKKIPFEQQENIIHLSLRLI